MCFQRQIPLHPRVPGQALGDSRGAAFLSLGSPLRYTVFICFL